MRHPASPPERRWGGFLAYQRQRAGGTGERITYRQPSVRRRRPGRCEPVCVAAVYLLAVSRVTTGVVAVVVAGLVAERFRVTPVRRR